MSRGRQGVNAPGLGTWPSPYRDTRLFAFVCLHGMHCDAREPVCRMRGLA